MDKVEFCNIWEENSKYYKRECYLCLARCASPDETSVSPVSILKVVVFPAPLTPRRPKHSPFLMPTHNCFTAAVCFRRKNDLYTFNENNLYFNENDLNILNKNKCN